MEKLKTKKIKKGRHFACGLPAFLDGMGISPRDTLFSCRKVIAFDKSCRYILNDGNQLAWSKLFGLCFGLFGIHRNSFRFGWRYNPVTGSIEIATLLYNGGNLKREHVCDVEVGNKYEFTICYAAALESVAFWVEDADDTEIAFETYDITVPKSRLKFGCGFYFGGRSKAPNDMEIKIVEGELPW